MSSETSMVAEGFRLQEQKWMWFGIVCISSSVFPKNRKEKFPILGMGYSHISAGNIFI